MIAYLSSIDLASYTQFISYWAVLGVFSSAALYFSKQLPISSRVENKPLAFMGTIDKKLGWIIMETPILIVVIYFYWQGSQPINPSAVIVGAFVFHYAYRALIFPHRIKVQGKTMPVSMVLSTMLFYTINGYLIGYYFGSLKAYPADWLLDPRFIIGATLFVVGWLINVTSDNILINLRGPGETGYKIPEGGLFKWVSCPNYFGEIMEWVGFAIMSWSLPGLMYAAWVSLALFSTGLGTHRWYLERFGQAYPNERKAVIPYIV